MEQFDSVLADSVMESDYIMFDDAVCMVKEVEEVDSDHLRFISEDDRERVEQWDELVGLYAYVS